MLKQNLQFNNKKCDVAIVGGGVVGSALFYMLSRYSDISRIVLVEKESGAALLNSNENNNSQTLHFGDIETNYTLEKARRVKEQAELLVGFLKRHGEGIYAKRSKMVLGVGDNEAQVLEERYREFLELFPKLKFLNRKEIAELEPRVIEGRDLREKVSAIWTPDGYAVNYRKLAEKFLEMGAEKPGFEYFFNVTVGEIKKDGGGYIVKTDQGDISARFVMVVSGPQSLVFAKQMGYGLDFGLLPVAGNFYSAPNVLNGKVYMVQLKGMPFAALHGDPDVDDPAKTRFGPTIRALPLLERHHYKTFFSFLKTSVWSLNGLISLLTLVADPNILKFIIKNVIYDIPYFGKKIFLRWEVRKIVPAMKDLELKLLRGQGGIRPQIVDITKRKMEFGTADITGDRIIFTITPSPGASVCLGYAMDAAEKIMKNFPNKFRFDKNGFLADHSVD